MTTRTNPRRRVRDLDVAELRGYAAELANSHLSQTPAYTRTRGGRIKLTGVHRTEQHALLAQLAEAAAFGTTSSDDVHGSRPVPRSRPPGAWEALALHAQITTHIGRWTRSLRLGARDSAEAAVRQLVAAAVVPAVCGDEVVRELAYHARRWRTMAATAVGWTAPAYAPRVDCPVVTCGQRDTLRVALERRAAFCRACGSVWDDVDGSIRLLAHYIARATDSRAAERVPVRSGWAGNGAWLVAPPA